MLTREKYRRVPDLYVVGIELELRDGTVMWLQALNPFEYDEARHDAATARSRLVLALKDHGSDELTRVRANFEHDGRDEAIERIVDAKAGKKLLQISDQLHDDPDWKERLEIVERGEEILARPLEDPERILLNEVSQAYNDELGRRLEAESSYQRQRLGDLDAEALWQEYQDLYLERRGTEVALAEFRLTEMWYATRCCVAVKTGDGWDHGQCEGHQVRVFDDKSEVRSLPEALQELMIAGLRKLELTEREAKNSARQLGSSESSQLPNAEAESTASTQTGTPSDAPGISSKPSATPSLSSAGLS